ncbi:hypothetical protein NE237_006711 [Protea cynaroides]|uniref:DUF4283 domain-containing protein n=1 Tax=Protea cynaroides TaxID=273540 RepID=A0A9Q0KMW4_9MAGN|nr:hypothetical protein NE237_006711 [Protea cynaroides]
MVAAQTERDAAITAKTEMEGQLKVADKKLLETEERFLKVEELTQEVMPGKAYRHQAIFEGLIKAWRCKFPVKVSATSAYQFLFNFTHELDLLNLLAEGPWMVSGSLILLER